MIGYPKLPKNLSKYPRISVLVANLIIRPVLQRKPIFCRYSVSPLGLYRPLGLYCHVGHWPLAISQDSFVNLNICTIVNHINVVINLLSYSYLINFIRSDRSSNIQTENKLQIKLPSQSTHKWTLQRWITDIEHSSRLLIVFISTHPPAPSMGAASHHIRKQSRWGKGKLGFLPTTLQ